MANVTFDGYKLLIDYTDQDFESLVSGLRSLVSLRFGQITDFNTAEMVEMFIELMAATGDRLYFMQERHAQETNIITARLRRNVILQARAIGYTPGTRKAATGEIQAVLDTTYAGNLVIPKGHLIYTKEDLNPQAFELQNDLVINAGDTEGDQVIKHCLTYTQAFDGDGTQDQTFVVDNGPFLDDGSCELTVNSEPWEQVENFLDSSGTDKHYVIQVDENDLATFLTGDGINGAVVPDLADVEIVYQTGGGKSGNQAAGSIEVNKTSFVTTLNESVRVTFTNAAATTGGDDREETDLIRVRAPRALSSLKRTVTRTDFQVNIEGGVVGVARAIAFSSDQDEAIPENTAWVYIVPTDGGAPSIELKDSVSAFLSDVETGKPLPLTMDLLVLDALYKTAVILGQIYIDPDADYALAVETVMGNIRNFFSYTNRDPKAPFDYTIDFGRAVSWSKLAAIIQNTYGVLYLQNLKFEGQDVATDLEPDEKEIPALDDSNFDTDYAGGGLEFIQLT